jgi:hypothetical protein
MIKDSKIFFKATLLNRKKWLGAIRAAFSIVLTASPAGKTKVTCAQIGIQKGNHAIFTNLFGRIHVYFQLVLDRFVQQARFS